MNSNQQNNHKKRNIAIVAVLVVFLLITGTFAWKDYNQHKTNELKSDGFGEQDVVLVENFDPTRTLQNGWKPYEPVKKEVFVRNKGTGDAIVRLELKEWAAMADFVNSVSDLRYMIDEKGDYIKSTESDIASAKDDLNDQIQGTNYANQGLNIEESMFYKDSEDTGDNSLSDKYWNDELEGYRVFQATVDGETAWYIMTQKGDANGQYGKHITLVHYGPEEVIAGNKDKRPNNEGVGQYHHEKFNDEEGAINPDCDLYDSFNFRDKTWDFDGYVADGDARVNLEDDNGKRYLVSLSTYLAKKEEYAEGVWIYIDEKAINADKVSGLSYDDNGNLPDDYTDYVYWSEVLEAGEETNLVMDSVILETVGNKLDLLLHIDMQAMDVSLINNEQWHTDYVPDILLETYRNFLER